MKPSHILTALLISLTSHTLLATPSFAQTRIITERQAIDYALANNYSLQRLRAQMNVAKANVSVASGQFEPQLFANTSRATSDVVTNADATEVFSSEQESTRYGLEGQLPWGTRYSFSTVNATSESASAGTVLSDTANASLSVQVSQPLLRGAGKQAAFSHVTQRKQSQSIAELEFKQQTRNLQAQVKQAYAAVYAAQESVKIAEENRDLAEKTLNYEQQRFEVGSIAAADIFRPDATVALRQDAVLTAKQSQRQAINQLKGLIFNQDSPDWQQALEVAPLEEQTAVTIDMRSDLDRALANREEFDILRLRAKSATIDVKRNKRNALPQLDLVGRYSETGFSSNGSIGDARQALSNDPGLGKSVQLNFSIPLTNRSARASIRSSKEQLRQIDIQHADAKYQIQLQVDSTAFAVNNSWHRVQAAERSVELAQKTLNAEEEKLAAGKSNSFFVLDLQSQLAAAKRQRINALSGYYIAKTRHQNVLGL